MKSRFPLTSIHKIHIFMQICSMTNNILSKTVYNTLPNQD